MKLLPKTLGLAAACLVLFLLNLLPTSEASWQALPSLPAVDLAQVSRVEVSNAIEKLRIERLSVDPASPDHGRWRMTEPAIVEVDAAQVLALVKLYASGVRMDARVDEGDYETYGVDHQHGKLVELFTGADTPVVSVWIGKNASGSTSFVRPSSGEEVFRADVGGRARYDRPPADWRQRLVLDADPEKMARILVSRGDERLVFSQIQGRWVLEAAAFAADAELTEVLAKALGRLRVLQFQNPAFEAGFDAPAADVEIEMESGERHRVLLGSRVDRGTAFVKVDEIPEVLRVSAQLGALLTLPVSSWRDRTMISIPTPEVAEITLTEQGITVAIEPADTGWRITQPPNMDADQLLVARAVEAITGLKAADIAPDLQFSPTGTRLVVRRRDGTSEVVELGAREQVGEERLVRARVVGRSTVYRIRETALEDVRQAFGRG